jgi:hypothetical protein
MGEGQRDFIASCGFLKYQDALFLIAGCVSVTSSATNRTQLNAHNLKKKRLHNTLNT